MAKRYYKLEQITTGIPIESYARNQPHIDGLIYLEEAPNKLSSWNGSAWVENETLVSQDYERQVATTDNNFIRVLDDLIITLLSKEIITLDDLPTKAKNKFNDRKSLRENI
jgi:hypothetical protein